MSNSGVVYGADGKAQRGWTWDAGDISPNKTVPIDPGGWVERLDDLGRAEVRVIMKSLHARESAAPEVIVPADAATPLLYRPATGHVVSVDAEGFETFVCELPGTAP